MEGTEEGNEAIANKRREIRNYREVWLYVESDGQVVKVRGLGMDSIQKMLTTNGVITRDQWWKICVTSNGKYLRSDASLNDFNL